jgi:hypothetical protein
MWPGRRKPGFQERLFDFDGPDSLCQVQNPSKSNQAPPGDVSSVTHDEQENPRLLVCLFQSQPAHRHAQPRVNNSFTLSLLVSPL